MDDNGFLKQMHDQIQQTRDIYIRTAHRYDVLSMCLVIPSMFLTTGSSIVAFLSSSNVVPIETQHILLVCLGIAGIFSTLVQSCTTSMRFETKGEMFRNAAGQYDQLLIKIQFEQVHQNEKNFVDTLEKRLLEIQSACKQYPPMEYMSRPLPYKSV